MLIDISQKWGMDVIAQTDLDLRVHRNQSIRSLGKMAFGILQTFWNRIEKYKNISDLQPESYLLKQIFASEEKSQEIKEILIEEKERKPMIELEAYKKKKKRGFK
jgi:glucosyl-3-phosphoglycerate synthase